MLTDRAALLLMLFTFASGLVIGFVAGREQEPPRPVLGTPPPLPTPTVWLSFRETEPPMRPGKFETWASLTY